MREITRSYGIVIAMLFGEHNPPHFHARYSGDTVAIDIRTLQVLEGRIAPRARELVIEWASQHQDELLADWELTSNGEQPRTIEPLR
jgi:hypothetical protein